MACVKERTLISTENGLVSARLQGFGRHTVNERLMITGERDSIVKTRLEVVRPLPEEDNTCLQRQRRAIINHGNHYATVDTFLT